jgi:hypothetical protein
MRRTPFIDFEAAARNRRRLLARRAEESLMDAHALNGLHRSLERPSSKRYSRLERLAKV